MEALITFFQKKVQRWLAIIITYLLLIIFLLSGIVFIIPFLASQMTAFFQVATNRITNIQLDLETNGITGIIQNT
jgi:predicted PurR-regulated permease PerM